MSIYRNGPCKDCEERYSGCHSECKRYLEWTEGIKEMKAAVYKAKGKDQALDEIAISASRKRKRWTGIR